LGGSGRSVRASVPIHSGVSFSAHTSAEPKCSTIFGQVRVSLQRSSRPAAGTRRSGSGCGSHHCGPSLPAWYSSSTPSGWAQRKLSAMRRPAMMGHRPSCTWRPASSRLKPRCSQPRRKLPDCDTPRPMLCVTAPATGLGVPASSARAVLKNMPTSRHAAKPMPSA
jgi:hypothetical protein